MENNKEQQQASETANNAQVKKQTQDFPNMPASSEKQTPPDIQKGDIEQSSELNDSGKTDNIDKDGN